MAFHQMLKIAEAVIAYHVDSIYVSILYLYRKISVSRIQYYNCLNKIILKISPDIFIEKEQLLFPKIYTKRLACLTGCL